jgi:hypothetical protein
MTLQSVILQLPSDVILNIESSRVKFWGGRVENSFNIGKGRKKNSRVNYPAVPFAKALAD